MNSLRYLLLFFAVISAGGAFAAAVSERRYEETLPVSCMVSVLLLFVCGVSGLLRWGVPLLLFLSAGLYLFAIGFAAAKGRFRAALRRLFTPGFFLFAFLFLFFFLLNYGRLVYEFDGLSHWGDVVKAMTQGDILSSDPLAHSTMASYPPGIPLFQYLAQKLWLLTGPGASFNESLLYHAYQVFFVSFLFPFFKELDFRRPYAYVVVLCGILAPCVIFPTAYLYLMVDPFIGMVFASGLAMAFTASGERGYPRAYVLLCVSMLALIKSAALLFSVFLAGFYICEEALSAGKGLPAALRRLCPSLPAAAGAALLPWGLWKISLTVHCTPINFAGKVDLNILLNVLLSRDTSYRKTLRDVYYTAFAELPSDTAFLGQNLLYPALFAFLLTALLFVLRQYSRRSLTGKKVCSALFWFCCSLLIAYVLGLGLTYMFSFSEYEAMRLASFSRYMGIPLLALWMTAFFLAVPLFRRLSFDRSMAAAAMLCLVVFFVPGQAYMSLINRGAVGIGREERAVCEDLFARFSRAARADTPGKIYFLSQEAPSEYDFYMAKFTFRPYDVSSSIGFSLGPPRDEEDLWARDRTPEEFQSALLSGGYDYLVIRDMNEYFRRTYSSLFTDPEEIKANSVYRVDPDTGLLTFFA